MGADRVTVGNGSCEILLSAADALLEPGAELVYAWPSFSVYPMLASMSGATEIRVPLDDDGAHDLDAMAREITAATRLVLVCNPNNPTATALPLEQIAEFVAGVPDHVAVIVDEAYVGVQPAPGPGRVGRAAGQALQPDPAAHVLEDLRPVRACGWATRWGPSASGAPSTTCASRSRSTPWPRRRPPRRCATRTRSPAGSRPRSSSGCTWSPSWTTRGLEHSESQANFSWISLGDRDEDAIVDGLAKQGVIVRAGAALGEEGRLRVTYGTRSENDRFLAALDSLI